MPPRIWSVNNETEEKLRKRVRRFLRGEYYASNIREEKVRDTRGQKKKVVADVDRQVLPSDKEDIGEMRIELKYRPTRNPPHSQIQLIENGEGLVLAWHLDDTHPELGRAHVEYEHNEGKERRPYSPNNQEDEYHPYRITIDILESIECETAFNILP